MNFVMSRQIIDFLCYNYNVFSYQPYQLQQVKPELSHNRYIPFFTSFRSYCCSNTEIQMSLAHAALDERDFKTTKKVH